jgi:Plasmid pRiA4b ORF-3-like protein.
MRKTVSSQFGKNQVKPAQKTIVFLVKYLRRRYVTRTIELKDTQTLDDLQEAIIYKSFNWSDPHLYSFFFDNKPYSRNRDMEYSFNPEPDESSIFDLFSSGKPHSTATKLKEIPFQVNQKFLLIFDFGDDHRFSISVVGFGQVQRGVKYPFLLESKGKAPEQYPEWDEEDE